MATITMSTNSDSTTNNAGTGNKKLRGALTVLQNDIDMADAVLQNGGTALAANDIIEAISDNAGLSLSDSSTIIEEIFELILSGLENGEDVKISSFGTFSVRHKKIRIGRNPKTGVEAPIKARNVVTFNSSNILKSKFK